MKRITKITKLDLEEMMTVLDSFPAVKNSKNLTTLQKEVLASFVEVQEAKEDGEAFWQTNDYIAKFLGVRKLSAIRARNRLIELGFIKLISKGKTGTASFYKVDFEALNAYSEVTDSEGGNDNIYPITNKQITNNFYLSSNNKKLLTNNENHLTNNENLSSNNENLLTSSFNKITDIPLLEKDIEVVEEVESKEKEEEEAIKFETIQNWSKGELLSLLTPRQKELNSGASKSMLLEFIQNNPDKVLMKVVS